MKGKGMNGATPSKREMFQMTREKSEAGNPKFETL